MKTTFTLSNYWLGALVFLLIFPIDSAFYALQGSLNWNLPFGFLGILIAFLNLGCIFFERNRSSSHIFVFLFFFLPMMMITLLSHRSEFADLYFWIKALAVFYAGYCFSGWISLREDRGIDSNFVMVVSFCFFVGALLISDRQGLNYLRIADGFLIFAFWVLVNLRSKLSFCLFSMFSCFVLYVIGSRFALASFLILLPSYLFLRFGFVGKVSLITLSIPLIFVAYLLGEMAFETLENVHENRLLRLIYSSEQDTSLSGRAEMLEDAWSIIAANPWLGDYKYYLDSAGDGAYAHNLISFWAEFGVFGALFILYVLVVLVGSIFGSAKKVASGSPAGGFVFACALYLVLGLLFAKSYVWIALYFLFGVALAFFKREVASLNEDYISSSATS